jgi:hypothetical protein
MHTPYELGFYKIPNFEMLVILFLFIWCNVLVVLELLLVTMKIFLQCAACLEIKTEKLKN